MIWVDGEIVPDDALKISVLDRTFEHGLGLFETLRTWNGKAVLLDRHLARMKMSAGILGLPLLEKTLPDSQAITRLIQANGLDDGLLRITCSGGRPDRLASTVWMTADPLPPAFPAEGISLVPLDAQEASWNPLLGYKTLNYWPNRLAHKLANKFTHDNEAIFVDSGGLVREGSRTNLFAVRHGRILTPRAESASLQPLLLPGIMRGVVMERASICGITVRVENLSLNSLRDVSEIFLTNAVRGVISVRRLEGREFDAPGPLTRRIQSDVSDWLHRGGMGT